MRYTARENIVKRNNRIVELLSEGFTSKEIAASLEMSPRTVEAAIDNMVLLNGCRNRTHLAVKFVKNNIS